MARIPFSFPRRILAGLLVGLLVGGGASWLLAPLTPWGQAWSKYQTQTTQQLGALHDTGVSTRAVEEHRTQRAREGLPLRAAYRWTQLVLFLALGATLMAVVPAMLRRPG